MIREARYTAVTQVTGKAHGPLVLFYQSYQVWRLSDMYLIYYVKFDFQIILLCYSKDISENMIIAMIHVL